MKEKITKLLLEIKSAHISNKSQLEEFRLKYLSKKGEISTLFEDFKKVSGELKKEMGQLLNTLKNEAQEKFSHLQKNIENENTSSNLNDLTMPADPIEIGSRHPLSIIRNEIIQIFNRLGFTVSEGPEIEDDWHVFTALNFPEEHPARDMQDTFFIEKSPDILLRTHTSSVQVRVMEKQKPPISRWFLF